MARRTVRAALALFIPAVIANAQASPPDSWSSAEAVKVFRESASSLNRGEKVPCPSKSEDQWTISAKLRSDLEEQFTNFTEKFTVLEVGAYFGYTTRLLSERFQRVIAVDAVPEFLQANREYNSDRSNIFYLNFHTLEDKWDIFSTNTIHVVFLDASHDLQTVMIDLENTLKLPSVSLIIFDDYGAEPGVKAIVHEYTARGLIKPLAFLGEGADGKPWRLRDGRELTEREAVACEVVRPGAAPVSQ